MRTSDEILRSARIIEPGVKNLAGQKYPGSYRSIFKGLGMRFKEVREYEPGDDIRFIDWNVSARMGHNHPYSKIFEEERELTVYILADVSSSILFGTSQRKCEMTNQLCADLALTAVKKYNAKVGLITFNNSVSAYIKPQKSYGHLKYMVETLSGGFTEQSGTNISNALQFLNTTVKSRSIVFILSDFISDEPYKDLLFATAKRHDIFGFRLFDKADINLPDNGLLLLQDMESGKRLFVDTWRQSSRKSYLEQFAKYDTTAKQCFEFAHAPLLPVETNAEFKYAFNDA